MGTRLCGWPEQAYVVLLALAGEPSRETREQMRRHREEQVRQPMIDLLNDLADVDPWYEGGLQYRDRIPVQPLGWGLARLEREQVGALGGHAVAA